MATIERMLPARLYKGSHEPDGEMCVMEAVAYVAGEQWSDRPQCASPVITQYCIELNDRMPDAERQRLLPYVMRLVGTRSTPEVEQRRVYRVADWAVRRFVVRALTAAGLDIEAARLRELSPIVDSSSAQAASAAWASAAEAAAGAAAWAAWASAGAAAAWAEAAAEAAGAAAWDDALLCLDDLLAIQ